jgi:hypothetical protein
VIPDPGPIVVPPTEVPIPEQPESPNEIPRDNGAATPEPGAFALAVVGVTMVQAWRRLRLKVA